MVGDKGVKKPYNWWETHGATCPILQKLALRICYPSKCILHFECLKHYLQKQNGNEEQQKVSGYSLYFHHLAASALSSGHIFQDVFFKIYKYFSGQVVY